MCNNVIIRKDIDRMLFAMLGKMEYVDLWWDSPNKAFDGQTPASVYWSGEDGRMKVYNYVGSYAYGALA